MKPRERITRARERTRENPSKGDSAEHVDGEGEGTKGRLGTKRRVN